MSANKIDGNVMADQKQLKMSLNTPLMRQYLEVKKRYKKEVLFFRMGDFYEMFLDDAIYTAEVLNIVLSKRGDNIPMCGIPHHSWSKYVHKILEKGRNIAICEQLEDPQEVSGRIIKRDVIRILTPGSIFEEELIDQNIQSRIASLYLLEKNESDQKNIYSLAVGEISTGDLILDRCNYSEIENKISFCNIKEMILPGKEISIDIQNIPCQLRYYNLGRSFIEKKIMDVFQISNLSVMELKEAEMNALYFLFHYIEEIAPRTKIEWQKPIREYKKSKMILDGSAIKMLEILKNQEGDQEGSLISILDHTKTVAGRRYLSGLLTSPLKDVVTIQSLYDTVDFFLEEKELRYSFQRELKGIKDIIRILHHLHNSPKMHHLNGLYYSLKAIQNIKKCLNQFKKPLPQKLLMDWEEIPLKMNPLDILEDILYLEKLPSFLDERRCIRFGYSEKLDEAFRLSESAHEILAEFEANEKEKYNLSSLKIRHSRTIGYFIEISKIMASKAPKHYVKRQTLTNAERFTMKELTELEDRILNAKEKIIAMQKSIVDQLVKDILLYTKELRKWTSMVSFLDVMISFAEVAFQNNYVRPQIEEGDELILKSSRHPVVEALFKEEVFISNDVHLNSTNRHLAILTGPNMSGKSTFVRQVGLIQIMAQAGSFIPAESAHLTIVDRIFTRIGAYDRLFKGESTFYVEMLECARIFENYTVNSLILLDEVGRGTSTFDGVSIARAIIEYLNTNKKGKVKTLFATHFTELADIIEPENGIVGLTVEVIEEDEQVVFLRKITDGIADKSYGIYVAELAGLPKEIVLRASELLGKLESSSLWKAVHPQKSSSFKKQGKYRKSTVGSIPEQLTIFKDD